MTTTPGPTTASGPIPRRPTARTARTVLTRVSAAFALAAALTGVGAGVASAAEAPPRPPAAVTSTDGTGHDGEVDAASSRRITVTNKSGYTLQLAGLIGDQYFEGHPEMGSTVGPGGSHNWELTYRYAATNEDWVTYRIIAPDGRDDGWVTLHMKVKSIGIWEPTVSVSCSSMSSVSGVVVDTGGSTATIKNPGAS